MSESIDPAEFAVKVVEQFEAREGIFQNRVNIEDWVPSEFDDTHKAQFLFYVTQLDYATKSQQLYQGATDLVKSSNEFFTPQYIFSLPETELTKLVVGYLKPRYANEAVYRYKMNSQKLIDEYRGDPINIFDSDEVENVVKRILTFRGFGPKTGNLFFRSTVNTLGLKYIGIEKVLPPVDIHDVRIAQLMGYIEGSDTDEKTVKAVKDLWNQACIQGKVNWLVFDKALWLLGSVGRPQDRGDILRLLFWLDI